MWVELSKFADVVSLEGVAPTKNKSVPIIALPTTAGTAAEVTINYVNTDEERNKKTIKYLHSLLMYYTTNQKGEYKKSLELSVNLLNRVEPGIYDKLTKLYGE